MKKDDLLDLDFKDITPSFPLDRREFLKLLGGGLTILFTVGDSEAFFQEARRKGFRPRLPEDFNAFLRIKEDGRVSCFTGKIEMGQGVITSLAQMLADELDIRLDSVDMVMGDTDLCPWDMGTFGSMTTRFFGPPLREAAAKAKAVLKELASEHLRVPVARLQTKDGVIFDKTQKKNQATYAQLTKGKKIARKLDKKSAVEPVSDFTIVNKPATRIDAPEKVTGKALFAGDMRLPGMMYAKILRPPAHGAKLKSVDTSAAEKIQGIQVVREGDMIAVLHPFPDEAEKAVTKIKAQYEIPETTVDDKTIFDHLLSVAQEVETVSEGGNLKTGEELSDETFEETYLNSYVAHAPIEPHTAAANIEGDKITVWASTQTPFSLQSQISRELGLPSKNVRIIPPFVGGGYGGKTSNRQGVEAARLTKLTGKPVQVAWSRAEEFFYDTFRPAAVVKIKSGIKDPGKISLWDYTVYFAGERGAQHFYDIPHHRTASSGGGWRGTPGSHPFGTGAWRAPSNNTNTFARESQIAIMASKAGIDPLEFRLKNLTDKKIRGILIAAAEKFGWKPAKSPSGRGYGISCGIDAGTYVAHIAEGETSRLCSRHGLIH
jgi:isoquinoline 1-oxidoreductase